MHIAKPLNLMILSVSGVIASLLMSTDVHAASKGPPGNGLIAYPCRVAPTQPDSPPPNQNICLVDPNKPIEPNVNPIQITFDGDNGLPTWSPTGKMLAYTNQDPATTLTSIMVMSVDDLLPKFLSPGVWPAWSSDGKEIAFTAPSATDPTTAEIWAMRPDGTKQRQLTDAPGFQKIGATWSPDGKFVAYTRSEPAPSRPPPAVHNSVWVTRVTGSVGGKDTHELTTGFICRGPTLCFHNLDADGDVIHDQPVIDAGSPAWSPISNKIIFWSGREGFRGQIWIIDADGKHRKQLTFPDKPPPQTQLTYPNNDDPRWSPDGNKILVSTNRHIVDIPSPPCPNPHACIVQIPEMWMMDADGSNPRFIAENTFGPFPADAAWQPVPRKERDRDEKEKDHAD